MERVYSAVYPDLRRLARHYLRQERAGHTLQPTNLINEVWVADTIAQTPPGVFLQAPGISLKF